MAKKATTDDIDSGQFPNPFEYESRTEGDTLVRVREDFTFKTPLSLEFGDWRIRAVGAKLYVEHYASSTWSEQGRFEL